MEVKEVVRAAQEAEVRGDLMRAIELLRRAESLYREVGNVGRAERMERHAARLQEKSPPSAPPPAAPSGTGPVPAPAELEAWCSFCCRPKAEVGPLVTGPTDAFICRACAAEALRWIR